MPSEPLQLDPSILLDALRAARKGASPGPGAYAWKTNKVLLSAAEAFARELVPDHVAQAFMMARLIAFQKPAVGVRGIATGTSFRRLVGRTLAR